MVGEICRHPIRHRTWRWPGQEAAVGFRWLRLVSLVAEYIADMFFSRRKLRQYVWKYDDELFRCQVTDGTGAEKPLSHGPNVPGLLAVDGNVRNYQRRENSRASK